MKKPTHNISNEDYHSPTGPLADKLSSSDLKEFFNKSGKHLEFKKQNPTRETDAMRFGTAFHSLMLEPHLFDEEYVIIPEFEPTELDKEGNVKPKTSGWKRTNDYKNQLKEFQKKNAGLKILTQEEWDRLQAMQESMRNSSMYIDHFGHAEGYNEATYVEGDYKVRCDRICEVDGKTIIIDIKTTDDASPEAFKKKVLALDYDLSAALYLDVAQGNEFYWVVVEREAPYSCCWYRMSDWVQNKGYWKLKTAVTNKAESELPLGGYAGYRAESTIVDL